MSILVLFENVEGVVEELGNMIDDNSIESITIIITERGGGIRVLANSERTMHQRMGRSVSDDAISDNSSEKGDGLEHVDDAEFAEDIGPYPRKFRSMRPFRARKPGL